MVSLDDIKAAAASIAGKLHRTPLWPSATLSRLAGRPVFLKLENLQKTGSFKPRGALHNVLRLGQSERQRGVITISAGNHAQALAYAAASAGVRSLVVMPASASAAKAEAARGYGAEVVLHGDVTQAFRRLDELREERGMAFIHPFDDEGTIAGQGTVGLEIVEDLPDVACVIAGVGGGGLVSGVASAVKSLRPRASVVGVEPEGAPGMRAALEAGRPVRLESLSTIADGLAAPFAGERNLEIVRRMVDDVVLVSDDEIRAAMRVLLERCKLLAEPAGAAAAAALLAGRTPGGPAGPVVVVVSGGNVAPGLLADCLSPGPPTR